MHSSTEDCIEDGPGVVLTLKDLGLEQVRVTARRARYGDEDVVLDVQQARQAGSRGGEPLDGCPSGFSLAAHKPPRQFIVNCHVPSTLYSLNTSPAAEHAEATDAHASV